MTVIDPNLANQVNSIFTGNNADLKASGSAKASATTLNQDDFLKLFTTQIANQDPFSPMDNSQMAAQLAQFSTVAGISEMNKSLKSVAEGLNGTRLGAASAMIGRSILVSSNITTPDGSGAYGGQITLAAASSDVKVNLLDSSGAVVKSIELGPQQKGDVPFYWDGTDGAGNRIANGALQVKISGAVATGVGTWTTVAGIQSPANAAETRLVTPIGTFSTEEALAIS